MPDLPCVNNDLSLSFLTYSQINEQICTFNLSSMGSNEFNASDINKALNCPTSQSDLVILGCQGLYNHIEYVRLFLLVDFVKSTVQNQLMNHC